MEGRGRRVKTPSTRLMILREKRDEKRDVQDQDAPHLKKRWGEGSCCPTYPAQAQTQLRAWNFKQKGPSSMCWSPFNSFIYLGGYQSLPLGSRRVRIYRGDAEEILTSENVVDDHTTIMLALPTKEAGYVRHLYIFTAHSVHSSF